jgi:hypothetical protein
MSGGVRVSVNTAGDGQASKLDNMAADRPPAQLVEGREDSGQSVRVQSSGANAVHPETQERPRMAVTLDSGPKVDPRTNSYRKATYEMRVSHSSAGGGTKIIREDR